MIKDLEFVELEVQSESAEWLYDGDDFIILED